MKLFEIADPVRRIPKESLTVETDPLPPIYSASILRGLEEIKKSYDDDLSVKAKEYAESAVAAPELDSDEEILEKAKDALEGKYADKKAKTEAQKEKELSELIEKKKKTIDDYSDSVRSVERMHADKERRAIEALSRNGLTRSSVFDLRKKQLEEDHVYDRARLDAKTEGTIASLDKRIEQVESEYQNALSSFEIDYAIALEDKIAKLTEKRDSLLSSYEKSKETKLDKAETKFLKNLEKENAAYEAEFKDYKDDKKKNYEERLKYAVEETNKLSANDKKRLLAKHSEELKEYLGLYYDRYMKQIGG